jgi:F-type H+-transporting ATPase subunit a
MTKYKTILLAIVLCLLGSVLPVQASSHAYEGDASINVKDIIFDHIGDAYEWHVTTIGDKHVSIPLPVIVFSHEKGFHAFLSNKLHHGESHEGFHIATEGDYKGKVVETTQTGEVKRPMLDLSLTKIAAGIVINSLLLVIIILCVSRWYRRHEASDEAPRGFVGMMEMLIMLVYDGIINPSVGKDYERYAPYLLTAFFFIFLSNLMGLVPFFPGGANVTGNIAITLVLAICTFLAVNLFGSREYWREVLWPDVPLWMKCPVPLMPVIEIFGLFTKPFALTVRLLANIMAGHSVILALVCIIFITHSMGALIGGSMTVVSVLFTIFMNVLELLVAFIQAYVFTMLSAVFIGLSRVEHHKE